MRPRKGSFFGTNAEKQADDPLRGLGELGVDDLEQDPGEILVDCSRVGQTRRQRNMRPVR